MTMPIPRSIGSATLLEIFDWCDQNIQCNNSAIRWDVSNYNWTVTIQNPEHQTLFLLRWGHLRL